MNNIIDIFVIMHTNILNTTAYYYFNLK